MFKGKIKACRGAGSQVPRFLWLHNVAHLHPGPSMEKSKCNTGALEGQFLEACKAQPMQCLPLLNLQLAESPHLGMSATTADTLQWHPPLGTELDALVDAGTPTHIKVPVLKRQCCCSFLYFCFMTFYLKPSTSWTSCQGHEEHTFGCKPQSAIVHGAYARRISVVPYV